MKTAEKKATPTTTDLFVGTRYPVGFFAWLRENRAIYDQFESMALEIFRDLGKKRWSHRNIIEVIRWSTRARDKDVTFKINNNWAKGLALYFMEQHPIYRGRFETRDAAGGFGS